jgi:hypothetical protein
MINLDNIRRLQKTIGTYSTAKLLAVNGYTLNQALLLLVRP